MNFQSKVTCPSCGSDIPISSDLLISGASFACSNKNCDVSISLDGASMETVKDAFDKFAELKETAIEEAQRNQV